MDSSCSICRSFGSKTPHKCYFENDQFKWELSLFAKEREYSEAQLLFCEKRWIDGELNPAQFDCRYNCGIIINSGTLPCQTSYPGFHNRLQVDGNKLIADADVYMRSTIGQIVPPDVRLRGLVNLMHHVGAYCTRTGNVVLIDLPADVLYRWLSEAKAWNAGYWADDQFRVCVNCDFKIINEEVRDVRGFRYWSHFKGYWLVWTGDKEQADQLMSTFGSIDDQDGNVGVCLCTSRVIFYQGDVNTVVRHLSGDAARQ
jgi:hypothetical protein